MARIVVALDVYVFHHSPFARFLFTSLVLSTLSFGLSRHCLSVFLRASSCGLVGVIELSCCVSAHIFERLGLRVRVRLRPYLPAGLPACLRVRARVRPKLRALLHYRKRYSFTLRRSSLRR